MQIWGHGNSIRFDQKTTLEELIVLHIGVLKEEWGVRKKVELQDVRRWGLGQNLDK